MRFEPFVADRIITFLVDDGEFKSNTAALNISISLVNDNPLVISCGPSLINYTENRDIQGMFKFGFMQLYNFGVFFDITTYSNFFIISSTRINKMD